MTGAPDAAAEHARSFTVAKVARLDILADIRQAMDRALAEGTTFETFRNELEPILRARGWWGREVRTDPLTGETRMVQLGSPRRLRTIFDTNLRIAVAAGKWAQIARLAHRRPWLRYIATLDDRTRPGHRRWHHSAPRPRLLADPFPALRLALPLHRAEPLRRRSRALRPDPLAATARGLEPHTAVDQPPHRHGSGRAHRHRSGLCPQSRHRRSGRRCPRHPHWNPAIIHFHPDRRSFDLFLQ